MIDINIGDAVRIWNWLPGGWFPTSALGVAGSALIVRLNREQLLFWWNLWKTRFAARRVADAGFSWASIAALERQLLTALFSALSLVDVEEVANLLAYLKLAGDVGTRPRSVLKLLLLTAFALDAFVLASMAVEAIVPDGSLMERWVIAAVLGGLGGLMAGHFTQAAGQRMRRNEVMEDILRWALTVGYSLRQVVISINEPQTIDMSEPAKARQSHRCAPGGSLWPLYAAGAYILALGVLGFWLRLAQIAALRAEGIPDLPGQQEILLALSVILVVFVALQAGMTWLGYSTALLGYESHLALQKTGKGSFLTVLDAEHRRAYLIALGTQLQLRLHEHVMRLNLRYGAKLPPGPLLDAAAVYDECVRAGRPRGPQARPPGPAARPRIKHQ